MIRKKKEKAFAIYLKIYIPSIYKQCYTGLTTYILWQLQLIDPKKDILDQKINSFLTFMFIKF